MTKPVGTIILKPPSALVATPKPWHGTPLEELWRIARDYRHKKPYFRFSAFQYRHPTEGYELKPWKRDLHSFVLSGDDILNNGPDLALFGYIEQAANDGADLAVSSRLEGGLEGFHIPMVDFCASSDLVNIGLEDKSLDLTNHELDDWEWRELAGLSYYKSGRSWHGWGRGYLLLDYVFSERMGRLLLLNRKNRAPIIDDRWVGWSLTKGACFLRITRHDTSRFVAEPRACFRPFKVKGLYP